jgi:sterol 3beta-glucosyltransferase
MRITLATVGTGGDMVPFARLARALVARGHEVSVHAWGFMSELFTGVGARFCAAGGGHTRAGLDAAFSTALRQPSPLQMIVTVVRFIHVEGAAEFYASARAALTGADLAIINLGDHLSQAAATALGTPWILWSATPPSHGEILARQDQLLAQVDERLTRHISAIAGIDFAVRLFRTPSSLLNLCAASPALVEIPKELSQWRVTGAFFEPARSAPAEELVRFAGAGPAPLLVTFGSLPDDQGRRSAAVVEALRSLRRRAIIVGQGPPDPDILWASSSAFADALGCVDGVLHHAGAGTTHEICRAGLPQATVPHLGDQYFWGAFLASRGLGPPPLHHLEVSADAIEDLLSALPSPEYRERAAALAPKLATEDGVAEAVKLIESAL